MAGKAISDLERKEIAAEFRKVVNMSPASLRKWLEGEASRRVGMTKQGAKVTARQDGVAVGHQMGERIIQLKAKSAAGFDEDDFKAMRKVVGYVHRHIKQRPEGDVTDTRWRKSLMNWGHDPLKHA